MAATVSTASAELDVLPPSDAQLAYDASAVGTQLQRIAKQLHPYYNGHCISTFDEEKQDGGGGEKGKAQAKGAQGPVPKRPLDRFRSTFRPEFKIRCFYVFLS